MGEFAVFTPEVAEGLIARGFKLVGYSDKAWFFEDSASLERAVAEILAAFTHKEQLTLPLGGIELILQKNFSKI